MNRTWRLLIGCVFALLLNACSIQMPAVPASTVVLLPTRTRPPTATLTPNPTHTPTPTPASTATPTPWPTLSIDRLKYRIVGYYPAWGESAHSYSPGRIAGNWLTHINYAFGQIDPATLTCVLVDSTIDHNNLIGLRQAKQNYPHLKVLIAIGGATFSNSFSEVALTDEARQKFVKSCLDLYVGSYPDVIDGFDLDWEFPGVGDSAHPEDKHNLTLLLQEFRRQLDGLSKRNGHAYLLTAAVPTSPGLYQNYELKELSKILDWLNLMAYDFHGAWDKTTNFNAPLYQSSGDPYKTNNIDAAVRGYLAAGVPSQKIMLGLPFYGRGWANVSSENNGLYQRSTKLPQGTFGGSAYAYWDLAENYVGQKDYVRYWNDGAKVPWLYSPTDKIFITYDDPESIGFKVDYLRAHQLGGAMIWNLGSDDGSLLGALYARLSTPTTP